MEMPQLVANGFHKGAGTIQRLDLMQFWYLIDLICKESYSCDNIPHSEGLSEVEAKIHIFSALDWGQWSASSSDCFIWCKWSCDSQWIGSLMEPGSTLSPTAKKKVTVSEGKQYCLRPFTDLPKLLRPSACTVEYNEKWFNYPCSQLIVSLL
jgi:hypothetical protein